MGLLDQAGGAIVSSVEAKLDGVFSGDPTEIVSQTVRVVSRSGRLDHGGVGRLRARLGRDAGLWGFGWAVHLHRPAAASWRNGLPIAVPRLFSRGDWRGAIAHGGDQANESATFETSIASRAILCRGLTRPSALRRRSSAFFRSRSLGSI